MDSVTRYIGLDVHKDSITIAVAEEGRCKAKLFSTIINDRAKLLKALGKLSSSGQFLEICYEAGPTGFGLHRFLQDEGYASAVIAPSLTPKKPGDRVKTDRRDARTLAHFLRSGDLTPIFVPTSQTEGIRDLERARDDAKTDDVRNRHRLSKFLLRHDRRWEGATNWTQGHLEWIRQQKFDQEPQNMVLRDYLTAVERAKERVDRLTQAIEEAVPDWHLAEVVKNLQALRGVRLLTAAVITAEVGNFLRFPSASKFMAYIGVVPTESSSADAFEPDKKRRGGITKTGNRHLRRMFIEAAHSYRFPPKMSITIRRRNKGLSQEIQDIAWKAQERLHRRYRKMSGRGRKRQVILTAIARELAGFVWDIARKSSIPQAA
jgi:transposase